MSPWWCSRYFLPKLLLQEPHSVTLQKTSFFRICIPLVPVVWYFYKNIGRQRKHTRRGFTGFRDGQTLVTWRVSSQVAATTSYLSHCEILWSSLSWASFLSDLPWPARTPFCANFPSGSMRIESTAASVCWGMLNLGWKIFLLGYIYSFSIWWQTSFFLGPFTYIAENSDSASYKNSNKTTAIFYA
jgi:hypothetical protein